MSKALTSTLLAAIFLISANSNAQTGLLASNEGIVKVSTDENGITVETRIVIEKEDGLAKIVFWQETRNGFFFRQANWTGNILLNLENGESMTLVDRNLKGHTMHPGAHIAGYFVPDVYQRYSAYYLSDFQCEQLKNIKLLSFVYHEDDEFETEPKTIYVDDIGQNLKVQIQAIGK